MSSKRYPSVLAAYHSTVWAILPAKLEAIRAFLAAKAAGEDVPPERVAEVVAGRRVGQAQVVGRVGVLPVFGVLMQRAGSLEQASGGVSTEQVGADLEALVEDRAVRSVVMAFDSPGGSVHGVGELAAKVRALGQRKKIVAVADSLAASAAYWVASQASELSVTPGGLVGSIGVLALHTDASKAEEMLGVKTTYVASAPYKAEGNPSEPLSAEGLAEMQRKVDQFHALFVKDVARGRGVTEARVEADYGKGRVLTARDALAAGLVDRVATLEQVLARQGVDAGTPASASRAAALARLWELESQG